MNKIKQALTTLLDLHKRESAGDETITMKEWNNAIKQAEKSLENDKEV